MDHARSTAQTHVDIDGRDFLLAPGQDLDDLMHRIEDAARSDGTFVRFDSNGVARSALISSTSRVVISTGEALSTGQPDLSEYARIDWDWED